MTFSNANAIIVLRSMLHRVIIINDIGKNNSNRTTTTWNENPIWSNHIRRVQRFLFHWKLTNSKQFVLNQNWITSHIWYDGKVIKNLSVNLNKYLIEQSEYFYSHHKSVFSTKMFICKVCLKYHSYYIYQKRFCRDQKTDLLSFSW